MLLGCALNFLTFFWKYENQKFSGCPQIMIQSSTSLFIPQLSAAILSFTFANLRRKIEGGKLSFVILIFTTKNSKHQGVLHINSFRLTGNADSGRSQLVIYNLAQSQEAMWHCGIFRQKAAEINHRNHF